MITITYKFKFLDENVLNFLLIYNKFNMILKSVSEDWLMID